MYIEHLEVIKQLRYKDEDIVSAHRLIERGRQINKA